ncbi:glycosyltransferase [Lentisphaerota bacterium WC36G]|nr:hypothetical protein LJT99_07490 [Lentisphaerae bacterium WC36]
MNSFLHCFWTGPSFPYGLRDFVKKWVRYLGQSNTEFIIIVWLTEDAYQAMNEYIAKKRFGDSIDTTFQDPFKIKGMRCNRVTLNFCSFYIAMFEPIVLMHNDLMQEIFWLLKNNKRYTSASNIARLMIVNICGGIYTDIDYLLPNPDIKFPRNMEELLKVFQKSSKIGFYLPIAETTSNELIENQCVILDPDFRRNLNRLFVRIEIMIRTGGLRDFKTEVETEHQYLDNPITKELNHSMFTRGLSSALMKAHKDRDIGTFLALTEVIYKNERLQGILFNRDSTSHIKNPPMIMGGTRHHNYSVTGFLTYEIAIEYFLDNLTVDTSSVYKKQHFNAFKNFFDKEHIDSQFEFSDINGDKYGMYSWANPGYGRLIKLEKTAKSIEKYYTQKRKNLIKKTLLLNFLKEFQGEKIFLFDKDRLVADYQQQISELIIMLTKIATNYIEIEEAKKIIKKFLFIALTNLKNNSPTEIGEWCVEILNRIEYREIKNLIDPESSRLCYQDLVDYLSI